MVYFGITNFMLLASLCYYIQVAALILENTFTSILDMAGVLLPFLKWFIGKSTSKGPKILNFLVRSPWNTIDVIGEVRLSTALLLIMILGLEDFRTQRSDATSDYLTNQENCMLSMEYLRVSVHHHYLQFMPSLTDSQLSINHLFNDFVPCYFPLLFAFHFN